MSHRSELGSLCYTVQLFCIDDAFIWSAFLARYYTSQDT